MSLSVRNSALTRRSPGRGLSVKRLLAGEVDWILEHLGDQCGNWRALRPGQGDVGKERMALEGFNDGDDSIMATDAQVIALGNVVGQDDAGVLADTRENGQEHTPFQRLGFINDDIGVVK